VDLNQVTVNVTDMDAALAFYQTLGLKLIVHTHERYARFELPSGGATFSLHLTDQPTVNGPTTYFECDDLDLICSALAAKGIEFDHGPVDQSWRWREARLRDPSGNIICLYHAGADRRFPPWRKEDM